MNSLVATAPLNRPALQWRERALYLWGAAFVAGNLALPHLTHLALGAAGGRALLPLFFFTLVGAGCFGRNVGLLTAVVSPLAAHALSGGVMPPVEALPVLLVKGGALALLAPLAVARARFIPLAVAAAVIGCQLVGGAFEWAWTGEFARAAQDVRVGWPGLLAQFVLGSLVLGAVARARASR
ncbi:MAG: hypothetical protein LBR07_08035 [Puniceicoccales bacterium]|jgi:hypothetical protein|nr:hypothetical protein [Puniceicoccales bacterium]